MIDTAKVADRRTLRYRSIEELLADIDKIVAADGAGTLRRTGNWTAGQIFGHLATWICYGWEGYPMKPPWFISFILHRKKTKYLRDGLPSGVRIPRVEGGTTGTEVLSTHEGATRLRHAVARLQSGEPCKHDSAFGPMPHEERIQFNLRHAELHLSFLHP